MDLIILSTGREDCDVESQTIVKLLMSLISCQCCTTSEHDVTSDKCGIFWSFVRLVDGPETDVILVDAMDFDEI